MKIGCRETINFFYMDNSIFQFKKFSVKHLESSMKVGVDGVLIGAWANCEGERILDVGAGCGLISLMMAQRNLKTKIIGIDIDPLSVKEAKFNFENSEWKERLTAEKISFNDFMENCVDRFDLIISNPPYFNSGIKKPKSPRMIARHQDSLSPYIILEKGIRMLKPGGRISMILPTDVFNEEIRDLIEEKYYLSRIQYVRRRKDLPPKRMLLEVINKS